MSEIMARIVERENKNTRIEVALSLIATGKLSIEEISKCSKLTIAEVEELEKQYRESCLL